MLLSHQRRASKNIIYRPVGSSATRDLSPLSPSGSQVTQGGINLNTSISMVKIQQKRKSVFLSSSDLLRIPNLKETLNDSKASGVNESRDISEGADSSIRGSRSRLLVQKDRNNNQIWVQRIPKLNASSDLVPPISQGMRRKVRAKAKIKNKSINPDSSTSMHADQLSQNDLSATPQQIEIPNNIQSDDLEDDKRLESIREDVHLETDGDQSSPVLTSKILVQRSNNKNPQHNDSLLPTPFQAEEKKAQDEKQMNNNAREHKRIKIVRKRSNNNSQTRSQNNQDNPLNQPNPKPSPQNQYKDFTNEKINTTVKVQQNIQDYQLSFVQNQNNGMIDLRPTLQMSEDSVPPKLTLLSESSAIKVPSSLTNMKSSTPANNSRLSFMPTTTNQNSRSNSEKKKAKQYEKSAKYQQISNTKISRPLPPSLNNLNLAKQQPQGGEVSMKESNEQAIWSRDDLKQREQGRSTSNAMSFTISSNTKNLDLNRFKESMPLKEQPSSQLPNLKQQILMNREKREKERQQSLTQEESKIKAQDIPSQSNTLAANKQQHTPVKPKQDSKYSTMIEERQATTSFPGENQRLDATPTNANKKKRLPEDMYPKESLEQPYLQNHDKSIIQKQNLINDLQRISKPIQPYSKAMSMIQPSEQTEILVTQQERMETSDFQSIDLMSVSNSVKQISPPQLPNLKQSVQSQQKQGPISSVNQSMYETPNFNLEDSTLDPTASQRLYVNLNKKISISRPGTTTNAQSLAKRLMNKVESLNSIEQLDQNSEISPPNKLMPTREDLRGSVISLDNYNNMSVRFNDNDSELRMSRPQSRAVYNHQIIRPNNDITSSPNNEGYESILMNESYEESIRNRLLNHLRENNPNIQNLRDTQQTRNFTQSLVNTAGHPALSNQISRFPSFGVHNAPPLSSNSQSLNQTLQLPAQGGDVSMMVPSLLRYNKSNINLKEPIAIKDSPNADEEEMLGEINEMAHPQERINTLMDSTKKIKIVRKEPTVSTVPQDQISNTFNDLLQESIQEHQLDVQSQSQGSSKIAAGIENEETKQSQNLKLRLNAPKKSEEELIMRLKSPTHQEFTLDPIREEQEVSPKQKLARYQHIYKASQKFLGISAQPHEMEPSPRETIQSFDKLNSNRLQNSSSLNSQNISIQSSPFMDMSQNKFFQLAKNKEMLMIGEEISYHRNAKNTLNELNLQYSQSQNEQIPEGLSPEKTQQLLTHRATTLKNETQSQFEQYKQKAALQNSDQKPKIKVSRINVMMDASQQKSFDSMSSALSNFTAPPAKQDPLKSLNLKKTTTEDVFTRLYNANNSNRNSKSPLRQSQTAGGLGQGATGFAGFGNSSHFSINQRVKGAASGSESQFTIGSAERNMLKSIGAYNSMTYGIKPQLDPVARDFNPYSSHMRISDLKDDINAHFSHMKVENSPMNSTGSRGLMPIINNREKKVVKLNLDDDPDEQISDNTSQNTQNTLGRAFQPMASQIMYATHTPSDISFLESFQDSARRSQQYKLGKPKADNMSLRSSHASINLASNYNSANSTAKKQIPRSKNTTVKKQPSLGSKNVVVGAQTTRSKQLVQRNQASTTQSAFNSRDHTPTASVFSAGARNGGDSSKNQFRRNDSTSSKQKLGLHQSRNSLSKPRIIEHEVFFEPYQEKKVIPLLKEQRVKNTKPQKNQFSHSTRFF